MLSFLYDRNWLTFEKSVHRNEMQKHLLLCGKYLIGVFSLLGQTTDEVILGFIWYGAFL